MPQTLKLPPLYRSFELERSSIDKEKRTVRVQFSSEVVVQRWFGKEILDHSKGAVNLNRLKAGAAVLLEHNPNQRIGITETAEITQNRTGEAIIRFSKSQRGEEAWQEVLDGTLRWVSVGYRVHRFKQEGDQEPESRGKEVTYRATSWEPLEISFVAIPADPTACVLRSDGNQEEREIPIEPNLRNMPTEQTPPAPAQNQTPAAAPPASAPAIVRSETEIREAERKRAQEIWAIAQQFERTGQEASDAIIKGTTVDDYRKLVMDSLKKKASGTDPESGGDNARSELVLPKGKTPGDLFIESDGYRAAVEKFKRSGKLPQGLSVFADVPYIRATLTTSGLTSIEKEPGVVLLEQQPTVMLHQVVPSIPTDATTVRYTQESAFVNDATALAEEGEYQEASLSLEEVDANVRKVGVIARITEEAFADYEYMRDYVNNRVRFMVDSRVDGHLLNGTGTNNQIKGLLNFSGIQTLSHTDGTAPDAIHKAITKVRTLGFFEPDLIVLNPVDWENLRLMKDQNGQYYAGGPFSLGAYGTGAMAVGTLWSKPVVLTTALASGTALVGAFRLGCAQRPKAGLSVETSNSDGSDFKYGRVAVRADRRLALCCYRPLAFCKVTNLH